MPFSCFPSLPAHLSAPNYRWWRWKERQARRSLFLEASYGCCGKNFNVRCKQGRGVACVFWTREGWLSRSNQTTTVEPAWGLSKLVDSEALPIPWLRTAQLLPSCILEGESDTQCLLLAQLSAGSYLEIEQRPAMCSGWDLDGAMRRPGSSLPIRASICPQPRHSLDAPAASTRVTHVPQGMGKILEKQWGKFHL